MHYEKIYGDRDRRVSCSKNFTCYQMISGADIHSWEFTCSFTGILYYCQVDKFSHDFFLQFALIAFFARVTETLSFRHMSVNSACDCNKLLIKLIDRFLEVSICKGPASDLL